MVWKTEHLLISFININTSFIDIDKYYQYDCLMLIMTNNLLQHLYEIDLLQKKIINIGKTSFIHLNWII